MTDILKALDNAQRRYVIEKQKTAQEHPSYLVLGAAAAQVINTAVVRRIAGKLGIPLTRGQAWVLVSIFGRDPGYPYNLIWQQQRQVKPEVQAAAKKLADELVSTLVKARGDRLKATVKTNAERMGRSVAEQGDPLTTLDDVFPYPRIRRHVGDNMTSPSSPLPPQKADDPAPRSTMWGTE